LFEDFMKKAVLISFLGLILILAFPFPSVAQMRVAFLEVYDSQGKLIQYEPGGRFGHVALEINQKWLQSYPGEGVQLISWQELRKRGVVAQVLLIPGTLTFLEIQAYLGMPFDFQYSWDNQAFYCSELLGKLLGIAPGPMRFNHDVWPPSYWHLEGLPGLSPDRLHFQLSQSGSGPTHP